ncbi:MAG TPA: response regulator transcription factor [Anaerolineales bacterium]|nr:response regulator transcription factor [Anaerolineales bacterium]
MAKIMIVISDKTIADFLGKVMTAYGHEPTIVTNSKDAITEANSLNPNLILLDFMMPDLSGFELCRVLRANQNLVQTPIIMISGDERIESRDNAFKAGVNDYVTVPFDFDDLKSRLNALIVG